MQELIAGGITTFLAQVLKKWPQFTIVNQGQTGRIRILVGILSIVTTILTAYLSGSLADSSTIGMIGQCISTFIFSTIAYYGVVRS